MGTEIKSSGKKTLQGVVKSAKMDKTAVVVVERRQKHPLYNKTIIRSTRFKIHDERNECKEGDIVRFIECRPISKDKHFRLLSVVTRAESVEGIPLEESVREALGGANAE